jgi:hypothetical protein
MLVQGYKPSLGDIVLLGIYGNPIPAMVDEFLDKAFSIAFALDSPVTEEALSKILTGLPRESHFTVTQEGLKALLRKYHQGGGQRFHDVV